jgi:superfamily II DNA or RNA helicase
VQPAGDIRWKLGSELREWQSDALAAWQANQDRGVAAVVTGGGKTVLAYACMLDLLRRRPDVRIVILVPTVALQDQWAVGLTDDLGVAEEDVALFGGGRRPPEPRRVNLMVINTGRTHAPPIAAVGPVMLVVDECHRIASPRNAEALVGPHVATLGLSATPDRDFDDLFTEVVEPALGPVMYRYDYNQARADGVITPFGLANVEVDLTAEEQSRYDKFTRQISVAYRRHQKGEDVEDRLHRLLRERARVSTGAHARLPAAVRIVDQHKRERLIVFHEQIDAANILTRALANRHHRVAAYHSGLGPAVRQDNLRMFKRGEIDVLVTCRALDEGINVPDASVAVLVASTASTRQRIQRLGRVLRPAPAKERAVVYTIYATEPEADRLRAEAEQLEGADEVRWLRLGSN